MSKVCSKCKEEKELSEYPKDKYTKDGYTTSCKSCRYSKTNEWAKNNYKENKADVLKKNSDWRRENWDSVYKQRKDSGSSRRSMNNWYHNKGKYNINYVIAERLRKRLRASVDRGYKHRSASHLLGCDVEHFKKHLESQFTEGMSWDNYGEWHIDHIKPCCSYDLTLMEEQSKCFHFTNMQPLWASDNSQKSKEDRKLSINKPTS